MGFFRDIISIGADILGVVGFILTFLTYLNTKKIKTNEGWVSFYREKEEDLDILRHNLDTVYMYIKESNITKEEILSAVQAMEASVSVVQRISQYPIWKGEANEIFSKMIRFQTQIGKIKAAQKNSSEGMTPVSISNIEKDTPLIFKNFTSIAEKVIQITEDNS